MQSPTTRGRGIGRYARSLAVALEAHDPDLVGSYLLNPRLAPPGELGALLESGKLVYSGTPEAIGPAARVYHALSPLDLSLRFGEIWPAAAAAAGLSFSATLYDLIPALDPEHELAEPGSRRRYRLLIEALRSTSTGCKPSHGVVELARRTAARVTGRRSGSWVSRLTRCSVRGGDGP